jgi:CheY-like chemotaxis protein
LLAGRKLLLADDSITIQKVVGLTFADEGVKVVSVGNGREAVERLEEVAPDIVLADVFMPEMSGYQVCEYIKQNEKLSHIPVMLLVGSFEPFDEAEARRVGADDILTKPFQSIRRLIDKVGALVTGPLDVETPGAKRPEEEMPTPEPAKPGTKEIEIRTADTQPFPMEERWEEQSTGKLTDQPQFEMQQDEAVETNLVEEEIGSPVAELQREASATSERAGDVLLDLGDFEPTNIVDADEFVLDLGLDEAQEASAVEKSPSSFAPAFLEKEVSRARTEEWGVVNREPADPAVTVAGFGPVTGEAEFLEATADAESSSALVERLADTQEWVRASGEGSARAAAAAAEPETLHEDSKRLQSISPTGQIQLEQLSSDVIDAIARRAVERLSEKVVQQIVWEVVPQLAELLIKRQLEEKESQPK